VARKGMSGSNIAVKAKGVPCPDGTEEHGPLEKSATSTTITPIAGVVVSANHREPESKEKCAGGILGRSQKAGR